MAKDAIMDMVVTEEVVDYWSELPQEMVALIMNKLRKPEISDYIRCGAVCTSWRTVFIDHDDHSAVTPPPFLIVPTPSSMSCSSTKSLSFYNVIDKRVYNQFQVTIPSNRYFRGSSHAWLVAVDQNYNNNDVCEVRLFNPFLSPRTPPVVPVNYSSSSSSHVVNAAAAADEILLPSLKDISIVIDETIDDHYRGDNHCFHDKSPSSYVYLRKAVLSADPLLNPIDFIVMAILGSHGKLTYCGPGCHNKGWTLVEFKYRNGWRFKDVIYCKEKFYALYEPGIVVVMDPTKNMKAVPLEIVPPRTLTSWNDTMYLVESAGSFFQVHREIDVGVEDTVTKREPYSTTRFSVFVLLEKTNNGKIYDIEKMNYQKRKPERQWRLLKNLGTSTLFLGDNHSMRVRASDYPGCKPNSIYFTDDYINIYHCKKWNGPHDQGVFNLVDGTIENHYPTDHSTPIWPAPIWIEPACYTDDDST